MNDNAKCFVKISKGIFEEISYSELEKRRKKINTYKNKKFIYIHGMLMEVSRQEYTDYYQEIERNRYAKKVLGKLQVISIDKLKEDQEFRDKEFIEDSNTNVETEIERKFEIEQLKDALLQLTDEEYKIIKALFYDKNTVREYAKKVGIPFTTIQNRKNKILKKLKKFLKI